MNKPVKTVHTDHSIWGPLQIAGGYLLLGALWILFSDRLAKQMSPNTEVLSQISLYKGWGYVLLTAILLYWLIRRNAASIKKVNEKYELLAENASDGIFISNASGFYTFANEQACQLVGYSKDEILSMKIRDLVAPEDLAFTPLRIDELRDGKALITERKLLHKNGSRIVCEISGKMLPDGSYQSIVRDITERKVTEEALIRSEKRYRSLFENMVNGYARCQMVYDAQGHPSDYIYLDVNNAFKKLTSWKDVIGKRVSDVIPGIHAANPELLEIYGRVASTGRSEHFETYVSGMGTGIWFSVSAYSSEKGFFIAIFETITERKRAEEALKQSYKQLLSFIEQAPLSIAMFDQNMNYLAVSRRWIHDYGRGNSDLVGRNHYEINPDLPDSWKEAHQKGLAGESLKNDDDLWVQEDGSKYWLRWAVTPWKDEQGMIGGIIISAEDISERKRAEANAFKSELRYHRILDAMMEGCQIIDFDWKYVYVNDVVVVQGRHTAQELLNHTMMEMYPGIEQTELFRVLRRCMEDREPTRMENQFIFPDGSVGWFELSIQPAEEGIFILSTDITERKQMENALRQSEQKFSILFEKSAFVGSLSVLADGRIIDVNEAFERAFGYTRQEAVGKTALELGINPDAETQTRIFAALKESNSIHTLETTLKTKSGESRLFSVNIDIVTIDGQKYILNTALDITERKQAEENVQESERRYRELVQNANSAILRWKHDGTITFFNEYAQSLFGYTAEEIVGKDVNILVPKTESTGSDLSELVEEIVQDPERFSHFVNENVCRDGHRVWMAWTNKPIYADNGEVTEILAVGVDITERKRAESQLRYQADLLSYVSDATFSTDDKRTIVSWNRAAEEMYGWSAEEAIGKSVDAVIRSDFTDDQRADAVRMLKETGRFKVVLLQYHRNGDPLWVEGETITLTNEAGQITGFVAVNRNITERKHSEEALHLSQENFARAFNSNPAALAITHVDDGIFLIVNESYTQIMGYEPDEILGQKVADLNIYVNADERNHLIRQLQEQGRVRNYELLVRSKSGEEKSLMVSMEPILYDNHASILSTFIDITEKKQAEEEIRRLNEDLEARVIERTSQLAAANRELESFSYSVSHDLRAPLRAIDGYTNILLEDYGSVLDEEGKRVCGIISRETKRMGRLIDDLLSFSRMGRREIHFQKIDMKQMVDSVFEELLRESDRSRIELQVADLPPITGDSALMRQVWVNLLSNAIKFTSKKERAVIRVENTESEEEIVYTVRDNGAGFEMEYAKKLFGVFQRLHGESEFEGTGVGLAIVQRVIHRHGGRIWAEGKTGEGATFQFLLPKRIVQA